MSDEELVKRLRSCAFTGVSNQQVVYVDKSALEQAAARIEALTAKNEMLGREVNIARYGQPDFAWSVHVQVMDDLNAKLAKAVELLIVCRDMFDEVAHPSDPLSKMLNDTLAEIKGEKG
jgi:chorismate synthase